jgi:hypothetical protein
MSIIESTQIAFFQHFGATGKNVSLSEMLDGIKGNAWKGQVKRLRAKGREAVGYDDDKKKLPAFMLSGTTNGGHKAADVIEHSGLLQIDVDEVGVEHVADLRDRIGEDRHILAAWISPSADGVKAIMRIPASVAGHKAAFAAAVDYMRESFGVEIDEKCSDVGRLCFVSHDPALVINLDAVPLPVPDIAPMKRERADADAQFDPLKSQNSSESYIPASCILDSSYYILHNNFLEDWPSLKPFYGRNISRFYGKPQRGQRNAAIVAITAHLFYMVQPELVFGLLCHYRQEHHDVFSDYPPADFAREVRAMLAGCEHSFQQELNESESRSYLELKEDDKPAFRIARSLSHCESDPSTPPPTFHLSCHELALRLGLFDTEAGRILQRLEKQGIIKMVKPGTQREKGVRGLATVWRWML